jgi:hypothetical protein
VFSFFHSGLDELPIWGNVIGCLVFIAVVRTLGYIILLRKGPRFNTSV